jgi:putative ABC transport system substrate-binding protein
MDRRRFLLTSLAGALAAPLAAGAQQGNRIRRVGVLMLYPEGDPEGQRRATVFRQELERRGWTVGRTLQIDYQWGVGDSDWIRSAAAGLLTRTPDVILANGGSTIRPVQQVAHGAVSVVFIGVADPVAQGVVQSLSRPGGNFTGFMVLEPSLGAKLLELLKEIAPHVTRAAVMFNPDNPGSLQLSESAAAAARKYAIEVVAAPVRQPKEIEAAMTRIERARPDGLIVLPAPSTNTQRKLIVELAARHRLPVIHALRAAVADGALMSYGVSIPDLFRQAAGYVDRILKGEKPADLPVQQPTKFELVINLKTAKALGLTIPPSLLLRADQVIE